MLFLGYFVYWYLFDKKMDVDGIVVNVIMMFVVFGESLILLYGWMLEIELVFYGLCLVLFWSGVFYWMFCLCVVSIGLIGLFVMIVGLKFVLVGMFSEYKIMLYYFGIMFWGVCFC